MLTRLPRGAWPLQVVTMAADLSCIVQRPAIPVEVLWGWYQQAHHSWGNTHHRNVLHPKQHDAEKLGIVERVMPTDAIAATLADPAVATLPDEVLKL